MTKTKKRRNIGVSRTKVRFTTKRKKEMNELIRNVSLFVKGKSITVHDVTCDDVSCIIQQMEGEENE